jgi:hypothetical protein
VKPQNNKMTSYAPGNDVYTDNSLQLENRRFTYEELEMITNNFEKVLGQGGFAKVYNGFLEDGSQVAVKLLSNSSIEGVSEFLAEVEFRSLTRVEVCVEKFQSEISYVMNIFPGSDFDPHSSQESCLFDWLLQRWGLHGTCL